MHLLYLLPAIVHEEHSKQKFFCAQGKRRVLSPPVVINADKNMYALGQDVLAVLDKACQETIPMLR